MERLFASLIISFAVIATASTSYAGDDRDDKRWDRDKKEQHHHEKKEYRSKKERHRKGGLPRCEAELAECTINLTETDALLQVCKDELVQCQATAGQAFPATGQTTCWDSSGTEIPCDGTGQDGDIQAGATLAYTDNGDGTITDDNTGLIWMKQDSNNLGCGSLPGSLDIDCRFTWDEAFVFVTSLNANAFAGHTDWRLPNVKELQSIVNYDNRAPAVSAAFNNGCVPDCTVELCSCTDEGLYWTSTSDLNPFFPLKYSVGFGDGVVLGNSPDAGQSVRAVRGGPSSLD